MLFEFLRKEIVQKFTGGQTTALYLKQVQVWYAARYLANINTVTEDRPLKENTEESWLRVKLGGRISLKNK